MREVVTTFPLRDLRTRARLASSVRSPMRRRLGPTMVLLMVATSMAALVTPSTGRWPPGAVKQHAVAGAARASRRQATIGLATAFLFHSSAAQANLAEDKLADILAKKVKDTEAQLGFKLDANDIREIEDLLRNKYCGASGGFSGEPGGSCAESPPAEATCFKATGFAASCTKSYGK